ncbi:uncharacterized protein [Amphiura filiformis]|uniref:uncharacterized protein isoform X2 n=1 Tax=Amphiura filiformis TaxID=82378 RepID=UPI003B21736C
MPSGEWDSFLKSNLKKYKKPEKTFKDVRPLLAEYKDLRPTIGAMETGRGKDKRLVCIQGTVPIKPPQPNQGRGFNMPVCVWLLDTHHEDPPAVYLAPIKDFVLQPSKYLDSKGKIYLPYLHEWKAPRSNLSDLFRIVRDIFSKYFPYMPVGAIGTQHQAQGAGGTMPGSGSPALGTRLLSGDRVSDPARVNNILRILPRPQETVKDIQTVLEVFPDLRVKPTAHAFTEGPRTEHLAIEGTIPIFYKGGNYNIPISVWLRNSYPTTPPACFVIPAQGMMVKKSKYVDPSGKVFLPYLHEWKYPSSDLPGLVQVMCLIFGESCPVYSTSEASPSRKPSVKTGQPGQQAATGNDIMLNLQMQTNQQEAGTSGAPSTSSAGPRLRLGDGTLVKKYKEENERLKDSQLCKICMDEEMQVLFMPCNHFATCDECGKILDKCPICREDIQNKIRVYKS